MPHTPDNPGLPYVPVTRTGRTRCRWLACAGFAAGDARVGSAAGDSHVPVTHVPGMPDVLRIPGQAKPQYLSISLRRIV